MWQSLSFVIFWGTWAKCHEGHTVPGSEVLENILFCCAFLASVEKRASNGVDENTHSRKNVFSDGWKDGCAVALRF